ncbi:MAG: hypothetical protein ACTHK2_04250 [Dokdonella sp.]|uniref:hypothetical protein n=1 Tax=Dokdonella sp. TaxID=2291710 RepID=UPI003F823DCD
MTDFEIQRGLRQMNTPRMPQADLWPGIAARIAAADAAPVSAPARRRRWLPFAAAAGVLLAIAGAFTAYTLEQQRAADAFIAGTASPLPVRVSPRDAHDLSRAPGGDPRLLGAAVVLDAAHAELEQALDQRPDAVFLVSLLNRTNARRMKLEHFGARAG